MIGCGSIIGFPPSPPSPSPHLLLQSLSKFQMIIIAVWLLPLGGRVIHHRSPHPHSSIVSGFTDTWHYLNQWVKRDIARVNCSAPGNEKMTLSRLESRPNDQESTMWTTLGHQFCDLTKVKIYKSVEVLPSSPTLHFQHPILLKVETFIIMQGVETVDYKFSVD